MQPITKIQIGEADKASDPAIYFKFGKTKTKTQRESLEQVETREQSREKVAKTCKVEEDSQC